MEILKQNVGIDVAKDSNEFIKILYLLCFEYFMQKLSLFKAIEKCITPRSGNLFTFGELASSVQPKGNALGKMYIIKNIAL